MLRARSAPGARVDDADVRTRGGTVAHCAFISIEDGGKPFKDELSRKSKHTGLFSQPSRVRAATNEASCMMCEQ
jgi:hypothetical protein